MSRLAVVATSQGAARYRRRREVAAGTGWSGCFEFAGLEGREEAVARSCGAGGALLMAIWTPVTPVVLASDHEAGLEVWAFLERHRGGRVAVGVAPQVVAAARVALGALQVVRPAVPAPRDRAGGLRACGHVAAFVESERRGQVAGLDRGIQTVVCGRGFAGSALGVVVGAGFAVGVAAWFYEFGDEVRPEADRHRRSQEALLSRDPEVLACRMITELADAAVCEAIYASS